MALRYYGFNIWPDTLNTWLKGQGDGYIGNGFLNWIAVTRYTKINPNPSGKSLEYRRLDATTSVLTSELDNSRPPIINVPGHFVIAKGKTATDFIINDPASNKTLLSTVSSTLLKAHTFVLSSTDLSYIMITHTPSTNLVLKNSSGNSIGSDYLEQPLIDDIDPSTNSGSILGIFLTEKPTAGNYTLYATGNYQFTFYYYDKNGNPLVASFSGNTTGNDPDRFTITIGSNVDIKTMIVRIVTIDSFIKDLENNQKLGLIIFKTEAIMTKILISANKNKDAVKVLKLIQQQLLAIHSKQLLLDDVNYLIIHL